MPDHSKDYKSFSHERILLIVYFRMFNWSDIKVIVNGSVYSFENPLDAGCYNWFDISVICDPFCNEEQNQSTVLRGYEIPVYERNLALGRLASCITLMHIITYLI